MRNPFDNDDSERFMARPSLDPEEDARELRRLLATRPEYMDISRMSNHEVRRQVARYRAEGKLPAENEHSARQSVHPNVQPLASAAAAAAASVAVAKTVTEEKRYPLIAALSYKQPNAENNKIIAPNYTLENEVTGPETRRSGKATPNAVRHREMLEGSYVLELQKHPRAARSLEPNK